MRTTGSQRTALRVSILIFWFACVWTPDLFGQGLTIQTASPLPDGVIGAAYSQTLTATGGIGPAYMWTLAMNSVSPRVFHCLPQGSSAERRQRPSLRILEYA